MNFLTQYGDTEGPLGLPMKDKQARLLDQLLKAMPQEDRQLARLVTAYLDRDQCGAAGSVDPVSAGGVLCSLAALTNVRTGVAQAHLLEMGLGGSASATR